MEQLNPLISSMITGIYLFLGFSGGSECKEVVCSAGDLGSIPGLGRAPGERHGNALQYSCLENSHGQRSLVGYNPWGHKESDTTEQLGTAHVVFLLLFILYPFVC